tara:strand:- start:2947 stop:3591 length:645 start_codon:yes stop_codon:yes gene_type:complete
LPKQKYIIRDFSGGMNTKRDPRDIAENESSLIINMSIDSIGKIKTMGGFYEHITPSSGSFTNATCDYNNDPTITHDADVRIVAGLYVKGTGIPSGATISSITDSTTFELSASTTTGAVSNGTLTFSKDAFLTEYISNSSVNIVDASDATKTGGGYNAFYFESDYSPYIENTITDRLHPGTSNPLALGTGSGTIQFVKTDSKPDASAASPVYEPA